MGLDGKNIVTTKISAQICNLLMGIVEQHYANIAHPVLISELGDEGAKFLIKENFLTKGFDLDHYWDGDDDKIVEWYDHLNSFAYLSLSGLVKVKAEDLKTYDANLGRFVDFFATELDVLPSSRIKASECIEGFLYFVGNAQIGKKKLAVFFARRLCDPNLFKKIDEFLIKQSPTNLPKLILTSSYNFYPESLRTGAKIISIPKLLGMANGKALFNIDYIFNILFSNAGDEFKPYVHCIQDGSVLFIGDKSWNVKGDKHRQIIKIMCEHYAENPDQKVRWNTLLDESDMETTSRFQDLFKGSPVKEAFAYGKGFVWFKIDEENLQKN